MPDRSLELVFIDELGEMYDAEKRLIHALPKLIKNATAGSLKMALAANVARCRDYVLRLERAFELMGEPPRRNSCNAMEGLLGESDCLLAESTQEAVRDSAILAGVQKIGHYEIASYVTLREWAQQLGQVALGTLLQQTVDEVTAADELLSQLALTLDHAAARVPG